MVVRACEYGCLEELKLRLVASPDEGDFELSMCNERVPPVQMRHCRKAAVLEELAVSERGLPLLMLLLGAVAFASRPKSFCRSKLALESSDADGVTAPGCTANSTSCRCRLLLFIVVFQVLEVAIV